MRERKPLFSEYDLLSALRNQEQKVKQEVAEIPANELLNTSTEDLVTFLVEKFKIETPQLREDQVTTHQVDADIGPSDYRTRGTVVTFYVPFDGEAPLFRVQASQYSSNPPHGKVGNGELQLVFEVRDHGAAALKGQFEAELAKVRQHLDWIEHDVAPFNERLPHLAREEVERRRDKLLKDRGLVEQLGYPLRERDDSSTTYVAPSVRRKPPVHRPKASSEPYRPEPAIEDKEYKHILAVLRGMVAVIERSPQAFADMGEEDLRHHFLVQLNGHYQGQATGETFNFEGKTDILVRDRGKNIFIAECKFWKGPAALSRTLDQLLGYASWRDTKTAVLLFNRNKDFSSVLSKVPEVARKHPSFKRQEESERETEWRFVLAHRDDPNRELIVTVMAFEVPKDKTVA